MRQIFSSQRVETAEAVAARLREAGIEVRMTNGRSYRTRRSGQFSYLDRPNSKNLPTVWVVKADDQFRARELMRQAGLLETTRRDPGQGTALDFSNVQIQPQRRANWGWLIRVCLLVVIAAVALFIMLQRPSQPAPAAGQPAPPATPAAQPATDPASEPGVGEDEFRVRIVPAS